MNADAGSGRIQVKREQMAQLAQWRRLKYREPELRRLFLEVTARCNERCLHCGSRCGEGKGSGAVSLDAAPPEVPTDVLLGVLADVKERLGIEGTQLCITGGESLLRPDFFELMAGARDLGYRWGMTTNGTLVTPDVARRLAECGMRTVAVSVDGLPETHDRFRQRPGSRAESVAGAVALAEQGSFKNVQIITVVHKWNIAELEELFEEFAALPIDSWRLTGIEPMGRALDHPELLLEPADYRRMIEFVRDLRADGWPVSYGCCHYLGAEFEREVRDAYFICSAGIYTASIMADGGIGTCLDIERRPETIQGNIYRDDFVDVWENRFGFFRRELSGLDKRCDGCGERDFCAGGSWHSFDFDAGRQRVCLKGELF